MTPAILVASLEDALRPLIEGEQGVLSVCESPEDTLALLSVKPDTFRAVLQWEGEDGDAVTYGTSALARIVIVLQTARGLQVEKGSDAFRAPVANPGGKPILELATRVRRFLLALVFAEDDNPDALRADIEHFVSGARRQCFRFISGEWLEIEGFNSHRQYAMTFAIRYADERTEDED